MTDPAGHAPPSIFDQAIEAHRRGRVDAAEELYRWIPADHPKRAEALHLHGLLCHQQGRSAEALELIEAALALQPDNALAWSSRAMVEARLGRAAAALASCDGALALAPDDPAALHRRGTLLAALKRPEEALASYDRALALEPDLVEALLDRGNALLELWRVEAGLASYDQALALQPDCAAARDNRALALAELGRFAEAEQAIEDSIACAPDRIHAYYVLTLLPRRWGAEDRHLQAMATLAETIGTQPPEAQAELHFALGKALAGLDPERAFRHVLAGNARHRRLVDYDEAATLALFERIQASYGAALLRRRAGRGADSAVPVFIIGMPRAGTSLVEQILASHPAVHGAGEVEDFERAVGALGTLAAPETVGDLSDSALSGIGERYLARLPPVDARRITNKLPWNFLAAGLIHLALPQARLIHVRRDKVDTCLSCFSHLFTANLPYSYDLGELGRYWRGYDRLMAHWRRVLPPDVLLEIDYEALVGDLETVARRMLAHCGLGWDARCLDFHRTERPVRTASMTQVRRPLYRSGIGRWRPDAAVLTPLLEALEAAE